MFCRSPVATLDNYTPSRRGRNTVLGTNRLLLLHLTVGSAVDLLGFTYERRKPVGASPRYVRPGGRSVEFTSTAPPALSPELVGVNWALVCVCVTGDFLLLCFFFDLTCQRSRSLREEAVCSAAVFWQSVEQVWRQRATDVFTGHAAGGGMKAAARHRRPFQRFCCCGVGLVAVIWITQVIQAPGETLIRTHGCVAATELQLSVLH